MPTHLRVNVGFRGLSDKDVAAAAVAVLDGLTVNVAAFPNPPVDLASLKLGFQHASGVSQLSATHTLPAGSIPISVRYDIPPPT